MRRFLKFLARTWHYLNNRPPDVCPSGERHRWGPWVSVPWDRKTEVVRERSCVLCGYLNQERCFPH